MGAEESEEFSRLIFEYSFNCFLDNENLLLLSSDEAPAEALLASDSDLDPDFTEESESSELTEVPDPFSN